MVSHKNILNFLEFVGLSIVGQSTNELTCDCPYCLKTRHLHFNVEKLVFNCKRCDESGTYRKLVEGLVEHAVLPASRKELVALAGARKLPIEAFRNRGIICDGSMYGIPVYNADGDLASVRRYRLGGTLMSAPGLGCGLYGAEQLGDMRRESEPVYLCEGEWDAIALDYYRRACDETGIVIAAPGAAVFKRHWAGWLDNRAIFVLYDNDDAGANGEVKAWRMLSTRARSLHFLRWPVATPDKFDVSDFLGAHHESSEA